ncbi:MAG: 3-dehydroquinate dehydratase [Citromicrobium sp.]|nr:3-dehydroquinate dehydratase [Citromicrobium sp.]MAO95307.1 3-dehydroquinate dehydratase [Citromicrobium sp.]MAS84900.1 3-dehydroquinate dehydratase [Erythrobacteraceae bacterium]MBT46914.1 3-dehydroquinate dehydratase [Citromicrobium sp.]|tara:strand:+ start:1074 stop:1508 length:435 start_codon:yes stop_codon:yes gene_type:complete
MPSTLFILNGPNLNLLGTREPEIYGTTTLAEIEAACAGKAHEHGLAVEFRQTNHEGTLVDWLHEAHAADAKAVIINAAAYTHTSVALLDAAKAITPPVIEVHLSDPQTREDFRHVSYIGEGAVACFKGKGLPSYLDAIDAAAAL